MAKLSSKHQQIQVFPGVLTLPNQIRPMVYTSEIDKSNKGINNNEVFDPSRFPARKFSLHNVSVLFE